MSKTKHRATAETRASPEQRPSGGAWTFVLDPRGVVVAVGGAQPQAVVAAPLTKSRFWLSLSAVSRADLQAEIARRRADPDMHESEPLLIGIDGETGETQTAEIARLTGLDGEPLVQVRVGSGSSLPVVASSSDPRGDTAADDGQPVRHLVDETLQGIILHDRMRLIYANAAAAAMLGHDRPSALVGLELRDVVSGTDYARIVGYYRARVAGEPAPTLYEFRARRADDTETDLENRVSWVTWKGRRVIRMALIDVSERVAAKRALEHSEQRFRDFTTAGSDWFWETDEQHRFTFISSSNRSISGMTPEDHYGNTRRGTNPGGVTEAEWAEHDWILSQHLPLRDFRYTRGDESGRVRHLSISGNPFYDPDGTFRGYRGVGRDVTAEVASREAERRATDLLGRAIERMPSPIVLWDAADRLLACNAQYRALFPGMDHLLRVGTHHREFTLTVIEDGLIQIDQPKPRAWYEERTARRRRGPNSRRLDFTTGQSFFVHDQIVEDGTLLTTFVEFGRVEALNQRIRSQEERYQAMLGAVSQAVITVDAKARIVAFNPAAEALFGYPADDVVGAKVDVLMTADQKLRPGGPLAVLRGSGRSPTNRKARRLKGLRRDGSEFPYEMIVTAWRSHDDRYMTGVIRDLTADLEMQRAMAEAQLAAEAASRAKSDFLASISHELRTPLNSILGFSQLLTTDRKTPLLDKHLRFASHIEKAGEHLLAMINQILDLAKIEAGRLEVQMEFVDIDEIVDECIELMQPVAAGRGIDLTVTPSTLGGMLFRADRTRMRQVLLNLLGNAIKYNNDGGWVRVDLARPTEKQLRLVVVDGGPGIPEDALETIFDLFGRLDRDRRRVDGSGLGLPLSRRLVELIGGTIGVSCPPEGGAVFALDFPLVDEKRALSDLYVSQGVAR